MLFSDNADLPPVMSRLERRFECLAPTQHTPFLTSDQLLHDISTMTACNTTGKKAAIVIMTDGEASDGDMAGDNAIFL